MRFIPTNVHGVGDYVIGLLLVAAPWLFGFYAGGAESFVPIVLGIGVIGYSLFTDYEAAAIRTIPMRTHLGLDTAAGLLLAVSPWLFGFAHIIVWPHALVGIIVILAAATTETEPASGRTPPTARDTQRSASP
jgi:hypothetical protein